MIARLVSLYALFAVFAIVANIATQWTSMALYTGPWSIPVSMVFGTIIGLIVKYVLDKRFIFGFQADSGLHEARTFALYAFMGIVTTGVFWATELSFHWVFGTDAMRYLGGVIGLAIGYWIKYWLDARFVFRRSSLNRPIASRQ